jgi:hypothetical protein
LFVGFSRIFLLGILIFRGITARRLYKSFGVKGLVKTRRKDSNINKGHAQRTNRIKQGGKKHEAIRGNGTRNKKQMKTVHKKKRRKEYTYLFPNFVTLLRGTSLNKLVLAQLSAITLFLR